MGRSLPVHYGTGRKIKNGKPTTWTWTVSVFGFVINSIVQYACHRQCLEDNYHMDRTGLSIFCVDILRCLMYGHCLNLLLLNQDRRGQLCVSERHECFHGP